MPQIRIINLRIVFMIGFWILELVSGEDWCYEGNCGPRNWKGTCKFGTSQSPVNIEPIRTIKAKADRKLIFSKSYYESHSFEVINNGHTVQFSLVPTATKGPSDLTVHGAGWKGTYAFLQMHFHWGSEHTIKGKRFPLELHIVHEQVSGKGGLGVLGIIFAQTVVSSKALQPIIEALPLVQKASNTPVKLKTQINLSTFLPKVWDVFRYEGSLTTPPCTEQILWSVFTQRMPVSKAQVNAFLTLTDKDGTLIDKNYRPVKPIVTKTRKAVYWMPVNKNKMIESAF